MKKCSIIIASYNEAENLEKCLGSLMNLNYTAEDVEIILVDNNSTDNTSEIVQKFTQVIYLKEEKPGASFARNKGIQHAKGEIMVFIDADAEADKDWLVKITSPFDDEKTGAVGGSIHPYNKNSIVSQYLSISLFSRYPRYGKKREIKGFPSCNLAIRKQHIPQGFDSDVLPHYGEDKDICYQVLKKGYKVLFEPEAIIYHHHPESTGELLKLFAKSSIGRLNISRKYPFAPDIILLKSHFPLLYTLVLLYTLFNKGILPFTLIASPALLYFIYASIISFIESKKFILSFFIKPFYDILSIYIIYGSYHYHGQRTK